MTQSKPVEPRGSSGSRKSPPLDEREREEIRGVKEARGWPSAVLLERNRLSFARMSLSGRTMREGH